MNICYSELILLGGPVIDNVKKLMSSGSQRIELMMDGAGWDDVNGTWSKLAIELPKTGASFSVHPAAWDTNLTSQTKVLRDATLQLHKDTILFASKIGAEQVVLHPGFSYSPAFDKKTAQRQAREATEELIEVAKPLGIRLAFENVGYNGSCLYTYDEFAAALDGLDDTVGYLIDTGHANINGWDIAKLIDKLSDRLYALHIHDNNGISDQHLPIYDGNIKWQPIFDNIKKMRDDFELILEYAPSIPLERLTEGKAILLMAQLY